MQHRVPVHLVWQEGWGHLTRIFRGPPQPGWVSAKFTAGVCSLFFQKEQSYGQFLQHLANLVVCKVFFSKLNACFVTLWIYRWNTSEGSALSINNPQQQREITYQQRSVSSPRARLVLWVCSSAQQNNQGFSGFKQRCLSYNPVILSHMRLLIMKRNLPPFIILMKCSFILLVIQVTTDIIELWVKYTLVRSNRKDNWALIKEYTFWTLLSCTANITITGFS